MPGPCKRLSDMHVGLRLIDGWRAFGNLGFAAIRLPIRRFLGGRAGSPAPFGGSFFLLPDLKRSRICPLEEFELMILVRIFESDTDTQQAHRPAVRAPESFVE